MIKYDYIVVGAGLYGATFARLMTDAGKRVLVLDRRPHLAGNAYTKAIENINVHVYGAHIFHTNNTDVWNFVNRFSEFNRYTNSPIANFHGEIYSLPFNMYTFNKMWGVVTPEEARKKVREQLTSSGILEPQNLEEQAISLVGIEIYKKLIQGYTEKQWGCSCKKLPCSIIKRLPVRYSYDNNYFNAKYQGIPVDGYTSMITRMLNGIEVRLNTDYLVNKSSLENICDRIVYTGPIDEYFDYVFGKLQYRSLKFEHKILDIANFQGNAVVNYTDLETPYTRIIEHKWFDFGKDINGQECAKTVITKEFPCEWRDGLEPYYPVNNSANIALYNKYKQLSLKEEKIIFAGRLGEYKYYDMDQVILSAMNKFSELN